MNRIYTNFDGYHYLNKGMTLGRVFYKGTKYHLDDAHHALRLTIALYNDGIIDMQEDDNGNHPLSNLNLRFTIKDKRYRVFNQTSSGLPNWMQMTALWLNLKQTDIFSSRYL